MASKSELKIGTRKLTVSNMGKVLYPANKFTKGQVLDYYVRVAVYLLPHLRDRPVTLVRYPDGVRGKSFYEKNAPGFTPDWIKTYPVPRTAEEGHINYILINDAATLIWVANLTALELHPFLHRAPDIQHPTHLVFDLDPGEGADVLDCAEISFLLRDLLARLGLASFPKVSGSKGIQVYVPINGPVGYEATSAFAHAVADLLTQDHPGRVLSKMAKTLRRGKVFIDWSQNAIKKTTIGVYSLRAKHNRPFVSMPVSWEELKKAVRKADTNSLYFDPEASLVRLQKVGDLFAPVLKLRQSLPKEFLARTDVVETKTGSSQRDLREYAAKRDFRKTEEPGPLVPTRSAQGSRRRFVVQKHAASHLHYDFRLEMGDVLKSWAVPKGVPLNCGEKRGAFATEDHPTDYLKFEGTIPEGQYGGGTVMVWDIGTYEAIEGNYYKGELTVFLTGRKLKGEWTLKRLKSEDERKTTWLLIKTGEDAKPIAAGKLDVSALTGRTMQRIAREKSAVWQSNRSSDDRTATPATPGAARRRLRPKRPEFVPPMRATRVDKLPEGPEWLYEIKWDGYRALAAKHGQDVRLLSLKNKNLATDFPTVVEAVRELSMDTALLDGEIVAVDAQGQPSFQALQNRASLGRDWHIVYYAFDLLNLEGKDLRQLPLESRKEQLEELLAGSSVRFNGDLPGTAEQITEAIKRARLEGVVAKRRDSVYIGRTRSLQWQEFKIARETERTPKFK